MAYSPRTPAFGHPHTSHMIGGLEEEHRHSPRRPRHEARPAHHVSSQHEHFRMPQPLLEHQEANCIAVARPTETQHELPQPPPFARSSHPRGLVPPPQSTPHPANGPSPSAFPQHHQPVASTYQPPYMVRDALPSNHPSHPQRCPPLKLEFLWKLYHRRHDPRQERHDERRERMDVMLSQGFPTGLASLMLEHSASHPVRIWLVDCSGTMLKDDGHLVSQSSKGKVEIVHCSRWEEVTSTIQWHAELAAWSQTPMAVRLLQDPGVQVGPQQVGVAASNHYSSPEEVHRLKTLLKKTRPNGATSRIHWHLQQLVPSIHGLIPVLEQTNKEVVVCVCTDSIPTDADGKEDPTMIHEFVATLTQLTNWPVQVVWRLSTDEERVVQFYQDLAVDNERLQVLDDFVSDCASVREHNPWLHYLYPLHLCREEGIRIPVFEALRKRPLNSEELCCAVGLIFGIAFPNELYGPEQDYSRFRGYLENFNKETGVLWNPIKKTFVPWIDMKKLDKMYDPRRKNRGSIRNLFSSNR